jgi:hypothetical protein
MADPLIVAFDGHPLTVDLRRDQAAELERLVGHATADPHSLAAAAKIRAVLDGDEPRVTFTGDERASLIAVLALALPDLDELLRQLYSALRDEARAEQS